MYLSVLQFLCDNQFDENLKFKAIVNDEDPEKMRQEPLGRDKMGLVYWFQKVCPILLFLIIGWPALRHRTRLVIKSKIISIKTYLVIVLGE